MTTFNYETKSCIVCNESSLVELERTKYQRWIGGEHVQNVWPEKTPDERELLITGTHPKCWDGMFAERYTQTDTETDTETVT